jgi:hypothetical protein
MVRALLSHLPNRPPMMRRVQGLTASLFRIILHGLERAATGSDDEGQHPEQPNRVSA